MSDFVALRPESIHREIRNTLFGDVPLADVVRAHPKVTLGEPWASFVRARDLRDSGDVVGAKNAMQQVLAMSDLETRVFLQVWHTMRELGETPPQERAKDVVGVVVEVGMPKGLDIVAAYRDHRARYFNYSGAGVLWERRDNSLDGLIDELLQAGALVAKAIGPWMQPRPPEPKNGTVRINLLTPSGIHLGQGPVEALNQDAMGGPILSAAFGLMKRLVELKREAE
ncbi:MAG TPA: hypothetical protein VGI45_12035 [Terracidiphilus sp.]